MQRTSIDRPELVYQLATIPYKKRATFSALRFLIAHPNVPAIPKTIVFFDSKAQAHQAKECLVEYMHRCENGFSLREARAAIEVYHRSTYDGDKRAIVADMRTEGRVRIVMATEALGLGINLPDIRRVVQYGIPKSLQPSVFL